MPRRSSYFWALGAFLVAAVLGFNGRVGHTTTVEKTSPAHLRLSLNRPSNQQRSVKLLHSEGLGAVFAMSPDEDSYYYTGNWIREARKVAPDSEGGRLALLEWMSTGECEQGGEEAFRKIISEGEVLLTKKIDAATAAQVHFMVGDAYSDIVAIAGGESGGNGDYAGDSEKEADSAHAKALEHYRAGLAIDNTSENAGQAWSQAWHLAAGLLPSERYVCFGD